MDTLFNIENHLLPIYSNYIATGKVKSYSIQICNVDTIKDVIEHFHYSKNVNGLVYKFCFALYDENKVLIGGMIFGNISMANVWKKYVKQESDLLELKRLAIIDNTPKNAESFFIGQALRWLKKNTSVKTILSYADESYGHEGIIYKASNFQHVGKTKEGKVIIYNGKRFHDKAIRTKYNDKLKPFAIKIKDALDSGNATYESSKQKNIYIYHLIKNHTTKGILNN